MDGRGNDVREGMRSRGGLLERDPNWFGEFAGLDGVSALTLRLGDGRLVSNSSDGSDTRRAWWWLSSLLNAVRSGGAFQLNSPSWCDTDEWLRDDPWFCDE